MVPMAANNPLITLEGKNADKAPAFKQPITI